MVYEVWLRLVQDEALYDAMLRGEHASMARALGFDDEQVAILEDFAIQPGTKWHVENLRFRAVTMVSRLLEWHLPGTLRLLTEGREGWLRDLVYEYLALHRWIEFGHHRRFTECARFAAFVEGRVLKRRRPPEHVEAVLAFERGGLNLLERAALLAPQDWGERLPENPDMSIRARRGAVQCRMTMPADLLGWLRAPSCDLGSVAARTTEVLLYVPASDSEIRFEQLSDGADRILENLKAPVPLGELARDLPGGTKEATRWAEIGILRA